MEHPVFQFQNVSDDILHNMNFEISTNEKVILFGPSGAGKSSLLFLFNRLRDPKQGDINYYGKPVTEYEISQLRRKVGLLLQSPNLFPGTVLDNLKYGPSLCGEWNPDDAKKLLEYVQLPESYLNRNVDQLSGGEQQRVSLGRTLANSPDVLLLDEPTSALDYRTAEEIEEVLERLIEEHQLTMIMVTHDLKQAKRLGERGLFLMDGELKEDGDIESMLTEPETEELKEFIQD
ncbi:phosphate ABC transporter ATP-binding protein [Thalassobacillus devorans]|uniref:Phosphate ABC transporter ATP-binding protein n=1 Tax=Thalassobacillus devorans TaxID=279813 RepID=A0ABQ1PBB2_9BACI|nr:phosphate ABC transporter ATP-binding protein [Thalassobacillus devorans]NIK29638.1 putative ABC transport system ATP-binding protein [Thalassobacillus devorans]GGC91676.1 phosphate ABC transporter ATP-binding protein [Thalassobacillus devorans]